MMGTFIAQYPCTGVKFYEIRVKLKQSNTTTYCPTFVNKDSLMHQDQVINNSDQGQYKPKDY